MKPTMALSVSPRFTVRALAAVLFGCSVLLTVFDLRRPPEEPLVAVVLVLLIVVGELVPVMLFDRHATAPLSTAASLSLVLMFTLDLTGPRGPSGEDVLSVIGVAMLLGALLCRAVGMKVAVTALAARYLGLLLVVVLFRQLRVWDGRTPAELVLDPGTARWVAAMLMLVCAAVGVALAEPLLEGLLRAHHDQSPLWRTVGVELQSGIGLSTALVSTAVMLALGEESLGVWAVPLFIAPLVFTQVAVVRYGVIRRTYTETVRALSRLTDVAGYTTSGHAERVSDLSVQMARVLGLSPRDVVSVEYAALLHDLGQVALREAIPGGATVLAAPVDQRRIARDGADIVRQTGVLKNVAVVLEAQTTPYRQVRELGEPLPMESRIVKVANAYDDLAGPEPSNAASGRALERISLGLGYEYDPKVVEAMVRVLERRRS